MKGLFSRRSRKSRRGWGRSGQTATEFMLVISVITIATAGATYYLLGPAGPWAEGFGNLNGSMQIQIDRGYIDNQSAL